MKKYLRFIVLFIVLVLCDSFFISQRNDFKSIEKDNNETYLDYIENKGEYTITKGEITSIIKPRSERSLEEDPNKWLGGTLSWLCMIEFETNDGRKVTDNFFPADTDNDYVGKTVEIAYYIRPDLGEAVVATRTEYIPDIIPLKRNMICIVIFTVASIAILAFTIIKLLRDCALSESE